MKIHANFRLFAATNFDATKYIASPAYGVNRFLLDRIGNEKARATTIVEYKANSYVWGPLVNRLLLSSRLTVYCSGMAESFLSTLTSEAKKYVPSCVCCCCLDRLTIIMLMNTTSF